MFGGVVQNPGTVAVTVAVILLLESAFFWGIRGIVREKPSFLWSTAGAAGFYILTIGAAAILLSGIGL